jgi:hypothetical protein
MVATTSCRVVQGETKASTQLVDEESGRGLSGWDWFWVVLAAILDIGHWGASATQRNQIPGRRTSEA